MLQSPVYRFCSDLKLPEVHSSIDINLSLHKGEQSQKTVRCSGVELNKEERPKNFDVIWGDANLRKHVFGSTTLLADQG